jgi:hypothetical protein
MENGLPIKLSRQQVQELTPLFGPPPVLSSEDAQHYDQTWQGLVACLVPQDFMELYLIRQVLNEIWKIARYTRHQAVGIERRFHTIREFQAQRTKEQKARKENLASELAEKTGKPATELSRLIELEGIVLSSVKDVDDICERTQRDIDHNKALEAGILFQEQLDRLINAALARRNNALEQLELYRAGLGRHCREMSNTIIEVEATEAATAAKEIEAPALAPGNQEPVAAEFPREIPVSAAQASSEEFDPLDSTRHTSYRSDVLRAKSRS